MSESTRITPRLQDAARWYQDVIRQGDLAEPAEIVRGCMVIKPHGYAIWEFLQAALDARFKATGHRNMYLPLLIPQSFLEREAQHVEGFAPELAVVTHAGNKPLEEPYVIRPTSETLVGHFFAKWISSHRDLPLLLNQWANVVRWELRTRMFLRTSEFLWQEGHTAHATHAEAQQEVRRMLDIYAEVCRDWLAMPVVRGIKSESEKFAGAVQSQCIEALLPDGKALQAGTSHDLGQNFGRAFDVTFQNAEGQTEHVWQTSWGVSTRLLGGMIMSHSDDAGLVLPPKVAPVQVVIVPIWGRGEEAAAAVRAAGEGLQRTLQEAGVRSVFDQRDHKPGYKYFEWEQKGVPLRVELGPRDVAQAQITVKSRLGGDKQTWPQNDALARVQAALAQMQVDLLVAAERRQAALTVEVDSFADLCAALEEEPSRFVLAHWDRTPQSETKIKEATRATLRCLPLEAAGGPGRCVVSGAPSPFRVLFAKAY